MKAVILAGGRGKRLAPLTDTIPKAMILINGKPMLEIIFGQLKTIGVTEVVVVVHYLKNKIIGHFGNSFQGIKIHYVEQKEMNGTADAVLMAEHFVDEAFMCIACDSLFDTALLKKIVQHTSEGVITVCSVQDPSRFGVIETNGDEVRRIVEKSLHPPSNLANFSIYLFPVTIFDACKKISKSPRGEYEITDAIQYLIDQGTRFEYEVGQEILDIGTLEQYERAQVLARKLGV